MIKECNDSQSLINITQKAKENPNNAKIQKLENSIDKLHSEIDSVRASQQRMASQNKYSLNFNYRFYLKGGVAFIMPRSRSIPFPTDNGLGLFMGVGQYLGKNHVLDLSLDWDIYPSLTLRYRFEMHIDNPQFTWGPVIGYKVKLASIKPIDNFLDNPDDIRPAFFTLGVMMGLPFQSSLLAFELLYLFNTQQFITLNAGMHFFL
jgi:hypothetical protein